MRQTADSAIRKALHFLNASQLPSGQFPVQMTVHTDVDRTPGKAQAVPELSPFATAFIARSLTYCDDQLGRQMTAKAIAFLMDERLPGDLWRYWTRNSPLAFQIPPDADDTSCISELLGRVCGTRLTNRKFLLLNRRSDGLFYTWIVPRPVLSLDVRYWWTLLRDQNLWRFALFFRRTTARKTDTDAVVNANVLLYLGDCAETKAVIKWLLHVAEQHAEERSGIWYRDRYAFYYALSRCFAAGIRSLEPVRSTMLSRIGEGAQSDGRIGDHVLQTALAACAIMDFGEAPAMLDRAVQHVLETQDADGGWESHAFYDNGREVADVSWGSRELTTGFCIEALARYSRLHARST